MLLYAFPRPSYFRYENEKYWLISTSSEEQNIDPGIYLYSAKALVFEKCLYKYNLDECFLFDHSQIYDQKNNILHMFGGQFDFYATYDLNTNKFTICDEYNDNELKEIAAFSTSCHINDNKYFIIGSKQNVFDISNHYFITFDANLTLLKIQNGFYPTLIYVPSNKLLFYISYRSGSIFYCNLFAKTVIKSHPCQDLWTNCNFGINEAELADAVLVFEYIIFIFCTNGDIHIFDTKYKLLKLTHSLGSKLVQHTQNYIFINNKNQTIDYIDISSNYLDIKIHYQLCPWKLIPKSLNDLYADESEILIDGYVKENAPDKSLSIPVAITKLILSYYPLFLLCDM